MEKRRKQKDEKEYDTWEESWTKDRKEKKTEEKEYSKQQKQKKKPDNKKKIIIQNTHKPNISFYPTKHKNHLKSKLSYHGNYRTPKLLYRAWKASYTRLTS